MVANQENQTHTILGSRTQRGLTQLAMDVLFRSIGDSMLDVSSLSSVLDSLQAYDSSESALIAAPYFLDSLYADTTQTTRAPSRAATPMLVRPRRTVSFVNSHYKTHSPKFLPKIPCTYPDSATPSPKSVRLVSAAEETIRLKEQ